MKEIKRFSIIGFLLYLLSYVVAFVQVYFIEPLFSFEKAKGAKYEIKSVSKVAVETREWLHSWLNLQQLYRCSSAI